MAGGSFFFFHAVHAITAPTVVQARILFAYHSKDLNRERSIKPKQHKQNTTQTQNQTKHKKHPQKLEIGAGEKMKRCEPVLLNDVVPPAILSHTSQSKSAYMASSASQLDQTVLDLSIDRFHLWSSISFSLTCTSYISNHRSMIQVCPAIKARHSWLSFPFLETTFTLPSGRYLTLVSTR